MTVDLSRIQEVASGDYETEVMLIDLFLSDSEELLAQLKTALATGDRNAMRQASHSLKGSAANMGAELLRSFFLELETIASEGVLDDAPPILLQVDSELSKITEFLHQYMKS